mgnify:CR=1
MMVCLPRLGTNECLLLFCTTRTLSQNCMEFLGMDEDSALSRFKGGSANDPQLVGSVAVGTKQVPNPDNSKEVEVEEQSQLEVENPTATTGL